MATDRNLMIEVIKIMAIVFIILCLMMAWVLFRVPTQTHSEAMQSFNKAAADSTNRTMSKEQCTNTNSYFYCYFIKS